MGCAGLLAVPAVSVTLVRPASSAEPELVLELAGDWLMVWDLVLGRGEAGSAWVLWYKLKFSSQIGGGHKP